MFFCLYLPSQRVISVKQLTCNVKVFWDVGGGEGEEEVAEVQKKSELTSLPNISLSE